jgi:hypothetical protein
MLMSEDCEIGGREAFSRGIIRDEAEEASVNRDCAKMHQSRKHSNERRIWYISSICFVAYIIPHFLNLYRKIDFTLTRAEKSE